MKSAPTTRDILLEISICRIFTNQIPIHTKGPHPSNMFVNEAVVIHFTTRTRTCSELITPS